MRLAVASVAAAALPAAAVSLAVGALAACAGARAPAPPPERSMSALDAPGPHVIAHRGASAHAPEHTFPAWDRAMEAGADFLEQDLQLTRDGVLVVLHDDTLDRTAAGPAADCRGRVSERTLEQIRRCDVGSWFNAEHPERARPEYEGLRIPTLAEVLARYAPRGARFYIETKNPDEAPGMEEALVAALREHELLDGSRVVVQSFSAASLRTMARLAPDLPRVQLVPGRATAASIRRGLDEVAGYARGIGPSRADVDAALVRAAGSRGLVIHPYTVNDPGQMRRLLDLGVHGMFTDDPALLRRVIESR